MSKKLLAAIGLVVVIAGSVLLYFARASSSENLVSPKRGEIVDAVYALGKVKSRHEYDLKIGVLSVVEQLFVREGDVVKKGAPLVRFTEGGLFRAPFDGVATIVNVDLGESATPQTEILRIEDFSDRFIEVSVEQQAALRIRRGQPAKVVFESLRGESFDGKVASLYSKNDEFLAQIEVEGLKENILPGMTADVAITVGRSANALLVPLKTINNGHVIVAHGRRNEKIPVEIGAIDGQWAEIKSGKLTENDQLVMGKK